MEVASCLALQWKSSGRQTALGRGFGGMEMGLGSRFNARGIALVSAPLVIVLTLVLVQPVHATASNCQQKNSCVLVFTTQPADAQVNAPLTDSPFGAGSSVAVQVRLANSDGSPSGTPVTGLSDTISLSLVKAPGNAAVVAGISNSSAVTDATGTATFSSASIDTHGSYQLVASDLSNARGVLPATSNTALSGSAATPYFTIYDDLQNCPPNCTASPSGSGHETVVISAPNANGKLASSLGADNRDKYLSQNGSLTTPCGAPARLKAQFGPDVTSIGGTLTGSGTKTVTLTYDQAYVNAQSNNGASFYQICYQPAPGDTFQDINNNTVTGPAVGLLPYPCGSTTKPFSKGTPVAAPCIASKTKNTGSGTVTIILLLPLSDPRVI